MEEVLGRYGGASAVLARRVNEHELYDLVELA